MARIGWEQRLSASLCTAKARRRSLGFDVAWDGAIRANPPRSSVEQEIAGAVKEFYRDAWDDGPCASCRKHGRARCGLTRFALDTWAPPDLSGSARVASAYSVLDAAKAA